MMKKISKKVHPMFSTVRTKDAMCVKNVSQLKPPSILKTEIHTTQLCSHFPTEILDEFAAISRKMTCCHHTVPDSAGSPTQYRRIINHCTKNSKKIFFLENIRPLIISKTIDILRISAIVRHVRNIVKSDY